MGLFGKKDPAKASNNDFDDDFMSDLDGMDSDLDGFDLDGEDIDSEKEREPSGPIASITGAISGIGREAAGGAAASIATKVAGALPGTKDAINDATYVVSDFMRLKNDVMKDVRPLVNQSKIVGRRLLPYAKDYMPTGLYKKIDDAFKTEDESQTPKISQDEMRQTNIDTQLGAIFKKQAAVDRADKQQAAVNRIIDQKMEQSRHQEVTGLVLDIRNQQFFQTQFLRSTYTAYLKKDLELKYRRLYLAEDTLQLLKVTAEMQEKRLDAIRHNTALPDSQKIHLTEIAKQKTREKIVGGVQSFVGNYFTNITKNLRTQLFDPMLESMKGLVDAGDMMADMLEMSDDMGMPKKKKSLLGKAMGFASKLGGGALGAKISEKTLEKIPLELRKSMVEYARMGKPGMVMLLDKIRSGKLQFQGSDNIQGFLENFAEGMDKSQGKFQNETFQDPNAAGTITKRFTTTVEEIIPGYLAKQTKLLSQIAGNKDAEEEYYDIKERKFKTKTQMQKDMTSLLMGSEGDRAYALKQNMDAVREAVNNADHIDEEQKKSFLADIDKNAQYVALMIQNLIMAKEDDFTYKDIKAVAEANGSDALKEVLTSNDWAKIAFKGIDPDIAQGMCQIFLMYMTNQDGTPNNLFSIQMKRRIQAGIMENSDRHRAAFQKALDLGYAPIMEGEMIKANKKGELEVSEDYLRDTWKEATTFKDKTQIYNKETGKMEDKEFYRFMGSEDSDDEQAFADRTDYSGKKTKVLWDKISDKWKESSGKEKVQAVAQKANDAALWVARKMGKEKEYLEAINVMDKKYKDVVQWAMQQKTDFAKWTDAQKEVAILKTYEFLMEQGEDFQDITHMLFTQDGKLRTDVTDQEWCEYLAKSDRVYQAASTIMKSEQTWAWMVRLILPKSVKLLGQLEESEVRIIQDTWEDGILNELYKMKPEEVKERILQLAKEKTAKEVQGLWRGVIRKKVDREAKAAGLEGEKIGGIREQSYAEEIDRQLARQASGERRESTREKRKAREEASKAEAEASKQVRKVETLPTAPTRYVNNFGIEGELDIDNYVKDKEGNIREKTKGEKNAERKAREKAERLASGKLSFGDRVGNLWGTTKELFGVDDTQGGPLVDKNIDLDQLRNSEQVEDFQEQQEQIRRSKTLVGRIGGTLRRGKEAVKTKLGMNKPEYTEDEIMDNTDLLYGDDLNNAREASQYDKGFRSRAARLASHARGVLTQNAILKSEDNRSFAQKLPFIGNRWFKKVQQGKTLEQIYEEERIAKEKKAEEDRLAQIAAARKSAAEGVGQGSAASQEALNALSNKPTESIRDKHARIAAEKAAAEAAAAQAAQNDEASGTPPVEEKKKGLFGGLRSAWNTVSGKVCGYTDKPTPVGTDAIAGEGEHVEVIAPIDGSQETQEILEEAIERNEEGPELREETDKVQDKNIIDTIRTRGPEYAAAAAAGGREIADKAAGWGASLREKVSKFKPSKEKKFGFFAKGGFTDDEDKKEGGFFSKLFTSKDPISIMQAQLKTQSKMLQALKKGVGYAKKSAGFFGKLLGGIAGAGGALFRGAGKAAGGLLSGAGSLASSALKGVGNIVPHLATAAGKAFGGLTDAGLWLGKKAGKGLELAGSGIKGALGLAKKGVMGLVPPVLKKAKDTVLGTLDLTKSIFVKFVDVYAKDQVAKGPLITAKEQKRGLVVYGNGKPIKDSYSIKHPVFYADIPDNMDKAGTCAIKQEDIDDGLVDKNNKPLGRISQKIGRVLGKIISPVTGAIGLVKKKVSKMLFGRFKKKKNPYIDVYVADDKGEIQVGHPRLLGERIRLGKYVNEDGEQLKSAWEIAIQNWLDVETRQVVLSEDEVKSGMYDAEGHSIPPKRGKIAKLLRAVTAPIRMPFKLIGKLGKKVKGLFSGLFGKDEKGKAIGNFFGNLWDKFDSGVKREDLETIVGQRLLKIYDLLDARLPKPTSIAGDADGDGDRDGSYKDQMEKRARAKRNQPSGPPISLGPSPQQGKQPQKEGKGLLGSIADGWEALKSGKGLLGKAARGVGAVGGWLGKKAGWLAGKVGLRGLATRLGAGAAGTALAGTAAGGMLGTAITGTLGAGASALGLTGTAAAIASNPIGWAVGAGLLAYTAYQGVKWFFSDSDNVENWKKVRYKAYGLPEDGGDQKDAIEELEKETLKILDGKRQPFTDKEFESFTEEFGIMGKNSKWYNPLSWFSDTDAEKKNDTKERINYFVDWYKTRFSPMFGIYVNYVGNNTDRQPGEDIDPDKLPDDDRLREQMLQTFQGELNKLLSPQVTSLVPTKEGYDAFAKKKQNEEKSKDPRVAAAQAQADKAKEHHLAASMLGAKKIKPDGKGGYVDADNPNKRISKEELEAQQAKVDKMNQAGAKKEEGSWFSKLFGPTAAAASTLNGNKDGADASGEDTRSGKEKISDIIDTVKNAAKKLAFAPWRKAENLFYGTKYKLKSLFSLESDNTADWNKARFEAYGITESDGKAKEAVVALEKDVLQILTQKRGELNDRELDRYARKFGLLNEKSAWYNPVGKLIDNINWLRGEEVGHESNKKEIMSYFYTWYQERFRPIFELYYVTIRQFMEKDEGLTELDPDTIPEKDRADIFQTFKNEANKLITSKNRNFVPTIQGWEAYQKLEEAQKKDTSSSKSPDDKAAETLEVAAPGTSPKKEKKDKEEGQPKAATPTPKPPVEDTDPLKSNNDFNPNDPKEWIRKKGLLAYTTYKLLTFGKSEEEVNWYNTKMQGYGVDIANKDQLSNIKDLEERMIKTIDKKESEMTDEDVETFARKFGLMAEKSSWWNPVGKAIDWYKGTGNEKNRKEIVNYFFTWCTLRFRPIFEQLVNIVSQVTKRDPGDLPDIDDIPDNRQEECFKLFQDAIKKVLSNPDTKKLLPSIEGFNSYLEDKSGSKQPDTPRVQNDPGAQAKAQQDQAQQDKKEEKPAIPKPEKRSDESLQEERKAKADAYAGMTPDQRREAYNRERAARRQRARLMDDIRTGGSMYTDQGKAMIEMVKNQQEAAEKGAIPPADKSVVDKYMNIAKKNAREAFDRYGKASYSQAQRTAPNKYDCSSFVSRTLREAGFAVPISNTSNLRKNLENVGFQWYGRNLGEGGTKITANIGLLPGDVLLKPGKHTEFYAGNGQSVGALGSDHGVITHDANWASYTGFLRLMGKPVTDSDIAKEAQQANQEDISTDVNPSRVSGDADNPAPGYQEEEETPDIAKPTEATVTSNPNHVAKLGHGLINSTGEAASGNPTKYKTKRVQFNGPNGEPAFVPSRTQQIEREKAEQAAQAAQAASFAPGQPTPAGQEGAAQAGPPPDMSGVKPANIQGEPGAIGNYVKRFESGKGGITTIAYDPPGGTSYGTYQLASKPGSFQEFIRSLKNTSPKAFAAIAPHLGKANTGSKTGLVPNLWLQQIKEGNITADIEHKYYQDKFYNKGLNLLKKENPEAAKFIEANRGTQEFFWSAAVQHGPAGAVRLVRDHYKPGMDHQTFIKAVYSDRFSAKYFPKLSKSSPRMLSNMAKNRGKEELSLILGLAGQPPKTDTPKNDQAVADSASAASTGTEDTTASTSAAASTSPQTGSTATGTNASGGATPDATAGSAVASSDTGSTPGGNTPAPPNSNASGDQASGSAPSTPSLADKIAERTGISTGGIQASIDQAQGKASAPEGGGTSEQPPTSKESAEGYTKLKKQPGISMEYPPAMKAALGKANALYMEKFGSPMLVTSGTRSLQKQAQLYKKLGPGKAAKPNPNAPHIKGFAADMNTPDLNKAEKAGILQKAGLYRPFWPKGLGRTPPESWHVELKGYREGKVNLDKEPESEQQGGKEPQSAELNKKQDVVTPKQQAEANAVVTASTGTPAPDTSSNASASSTDTSSGSSGNTAVASTGSAGTATNPAIQQDIDRRVATETVALAQETPSVSTASPSATPAVFNQDTPASNAPRAEADTPVKTGSVGSPIEHDAQLAELKLISSILGGLREDMKGYFSTPPQQTQPQPVVSNNPEVRKTSEPVTSQNDQSGAVQLVMQGLRELMTEMQKNEKGRVGSSTPPQPDPIKVSNPIHVQKKPASYFQERASWS